MCTICNKSYMNPSTLQGHMAKHEAIEKPYKCDHCEKRYYFRDNMQTHRRKSHCSQSHFPDMISPGGSTSKDA